MKETYSDTCEKLYAGLKEDFPELWNQLDDWTGSSYRRMLFNLIVIIKYPYPEKIAKPISQYDSISKYWDAVEQTQKDVFEYIYENKDLLPFWLL